MAGETTSRARAAAKTAPLIKQTFTYNGGLATFICSNALSPLLTCSWKRAALARKWVADPILHGGVTDTHWMCDGRWTPPTPTRPWHAETPPGELRPQCGRNLAPPGSDGVGLLQRSSHQSGSEKSPRSWYGGTRHLPGACQLAPGWTRLGRLAQSRGSWALGRTSLPRQAGATQERCRSWRTRISTSTPSPISWSACGTRF